MKKLQMIAGLCCMGSAVFAAGNVLENSGFENWYPETKSPSKAGWRYAASVKGKDGFAAYERSDKEKHSGKYSLHLKDTVGGNYNHSLLYQLSPNEIAPLRGKDAVLSVWIKQISASAPDAVGISITVGGKKRVSGQVWVNAKGAVDWKRYEIKIKVPQDADGAQICLCCASGWGRTAEAYFDDMEFVPAPAKEGVKK